jgi:hypothetical protein
MRNRFDLPLLLLASLAFAAAMAHCSAPPGDDDLPPTLPPMTPFPTLPPTPTPSPTPTPVKPLDGLFVVSDLVTDIGLASANMRVPGDFGVANAAGAVTLEVPPSAVFDVDVGATGYPATHLIGEAGELNFVHRGRALLNSDRDLVAAQLGITLDPSKATVVVLVMETGLGPAITGSTVDIEAPYEAAAAHGIWGWTPGNTIPIDGLGPVVFFNVSPALFQVEITAGNGAACNSSPGAAPMLLSQCWANETTSLTYLCPP